jgi:hypothetical protein
MKLVSRLMLTSLMLFMMTEMTDAQSARRPEVISGEDSMKGQTAMSVAISIDGIKDIPESIFRSDIEAALKQNGITILPQSDPPKYPILRLLVTVTPWKDGSGNQYALYELSLELRQILSLQSRGGTPKLVEGTTWKTGSYGIVPMTQSSSIRGYAESLLPVFIDTYLKVNTR